MCRSDIIESLIQAKTYEMPKEEEEPEEYIEAEVPQMNKVSSAVSGG